MSSIEHLEHELASNSSLVQSLNKDVSELNQRVRRLMAQGQTQPSGLVLPGPGADTVSRVEFRKYQDQMEERIKQIEEVAFEAVRLLDRMAGMGD